MYRLTGRLYLQGPGSTRELFLYTVSNLNKLCFLPVPEYVMLQCPRTMTSDRSCGRRFMHTTGSTVRDHWRKWGKYLPWGRLIFVYGPWIYHILLIFLTSCDIHFGFLEHCGQSPWIESATDVEDVMESCAEWAIGLGKQRPSVNMMSSSAISLLKLPPRTASKIIYKIKKKQC
jgi:hypothetical protein